MRQLLQELTKLRSRKTKWSKSRSMRKAKLRQRVGAKGSSSKLNPKQRRQRQKAALASSKKRKGRKVVRRLLKFT